MNIKEWLVPMLKRYYGEIRHFDSNAWPESYLGKAREEQSGYGQGAMRQHFKEVRSREGLRIRRAIEGMPYDARAVLDAHFTPADIMVKEKAKALGISEGTYWNLLNCAYFYLAGRLETLESQPVETKVKINWFTT